MNTQSHAILTFFLIRKPFSPWAEKLGRINTILFTGALMPDLPLYIFFCWYTLFDPAPQWAIWRELYFLSGWQIAFSASHSFPLWIGTGVLFAGFRKIRPALFCLAGFLSSAQDFLLHHEDAHAHFFPLSDYRFRSPVSYWNPEYYGHYSSIAEFVLVAAAAVWAFSRLEKWWSKCLLVLATAWLFITNNMWSWIFTYL